jgi:ArsR family transcriptional regulator
MSRKFASLSKIFRALTDQNRLKILQLVYKKEVKCKKSRFLCTDEATIKDLSGSLRITVPTISHHIKELLYAGLIRTKKKGRKVYCRINQRTFLKAYSFLGGFLKSFLLNKNKKKK